MKIFRILFVINQAILINHKMIFVETFLSPFNYYFFLHSWKIRLLRIYIYIFRFHRSTKRANFRGGEGGREGRTKPRRRNRNGAESATIASAYLVPRKSRISFNFELSRGRSLEPGTDNMGREETFPKNNGNLLLASKHAYPI